MAKHPCDIVISITRIYIAKDIVAEDHLEAERVFKEICKLYDKLSDGDKARIIESKFTPRDTYVQINATNPKKD